MTILYRDHYREQWESGQAMALAKPLTLEERKRLVAWARDKRSLYARDIMDYEATVQRERAHVERLEAALREADKNLSLRVGYDRRPDAHYLNRAHEVIRAALAAQL